jgi:chaperone required for assembly of F1-ATPase
MVARQRAGVPSRPPCSKSPALPETTNNLEKPRRFYKAVDTAPAAGGFAVRLDGRIPKSPGGRRLEVPTEALAELIAAEWRAQDVFIDMGTMQLTRLAFTAMDAVALARESTAQALADYAGSDLVCYFAEAPGSLVARQQEAWGPLLDWADTELGVALVRAQGILHRGQPDESLARARALALEADDFRLAGLVFGAALFGSAVLTLALAQGRITGEEAFALSRLDETFQEERWGVDEEAATRTAAMAVEATMLELWFRALSAGG